MKLMLLPLLLASVLLFACTKKESVPLARGVEKIPDFCSGQHKSEMYNFGKAFPMEGGFELRLCGVKKSDGRFWGEVFFQASSGTGKKVTTLGGPSDIYGPLATSYVQTDIIKDGLEVTRLVPYRGQFIPTFKYNIQCTKNGCETSEKKTCVFNNPTGRSNGEVLKKFADYIKRQGPIPSHQDIVELMDNAMVGEKASAKLLLSEALKDKVESHGGAHQGQAVTLGATRRILNQLIKLGCTTL